MEAVGDFSAYSLSVFSFKDTQYLEASEELQAREQTDGSAEAPLPASHREGPDSDTTKISRCSISKTTLKFVGISVVSLEACPHVELPSVKAAFQQDSCIMSVEYDSVVRLNIPPVRRVVVSASSPPTR